MNNQPKFKKGDRVFCICMTELNGTVIDVWDETAWKVKFDTHYTWMLMHESEIELIQSPTPDMLAIPDDHVFTEPSNQQ